MEKVVKNVKKSILFVMFCLMSLFSMSVNAQICDAKRWGIYRFNFAIISTGHYPGTSEEVKCEYYFCVMTSCDFKSYHIPGKFKPGPAPRGKWKGGDDLGYICGEGKDPAECPFDPVA